MMAALMRLIRVAAALIIAIIMGALALLVLSPLAGDALMGGFSHFMDALLAADEPANLIVATVTGMGRLVMVLTVAPVVFIGLVGEVARWRSMLWYVAGTALLTAAIPWIMRGGWLTATPGEMRVSAYLAVAGLISGTIYWLIAGSRVAAKAYTEGA